MIRLYGELIVLESMVQSHNDLPAKSWKGIGPVKTVLKYESMQFHGGIYSVLMESNPLAIVPAILAPQVRPELAFGGMNYLRFRCRLRQKGHLSDCHLLVPLPGAHRSTNLIGSHNRVVCGPFEAPDELRKLDRKCLGHGVGCI